MKRTLIKILAAITLIALACSAQAQTSESNPKLKEALKRYPQADTNKDGVLTLDEAKAFKEKAGKPDKKDSRATNTAEKLVYKTVGKDQLSLYVFKPQGHSADAKVPAIVFFHGGGFKSGSPDQFAKQAEYLAARGMVAVSVAYRLTSQQGVEVTDCVEDAISAMRWVRANAGKLGVDPDRIASGGGSAGGYLAISALMLDSVKAESDPPGVSSKPNAMVLFNPGIGGKEKDGKPDPRDPQGKGDLSTYVKPGQPPTIIFHGTADKTVPFATVEAFTAVMKKAGNSCNLVAYEGEGHSFFNNDKYFKLTIAETDKFLTGLGWMAKK